MYRHPKLNAETCPKRKITQYSGPVQCLYIYPNVTYSCVVWLYIITGLDWTGLPLELKVQYYASILGHTDGILHEVMCMYYLYAYACSLESINL